MDSLHADPDLARADALATELRALFVKLKRRLREQGSAGDEDYFYRDDPFLCGAGRIACVVSATGEVNCVFSCGTFFS